jgi:predicted helicase
MKDVTKYLSSLKRKLAKGDATEHTYRPVLEGFIESYKRGHSVTNEPRRIKCGAPDLLISRKEVPLGYIETKDIGIDLRIIEKDAKKKTPKTDNGKQLKRYLGSLSNLIFTDYLEFFWYRNGERVLDVRIGHETGSGKIIADKNSFDDFTRLLDRFFEEKTLEIDSPVILAQKMASIAQLIREVIIGALDDDDEGGNLRDQMESFKKVLIHDLNEEQFADMYAQTICYGLFAARFNHAGKEAFTRKSATYELPKTNPFLRKTFGHIAGPELDERVAWLFDDLSEILNCADIDAIGKDFGQRTRREDPVVHFYETFLAAYDPKMREARGVYYTPEPVVSFIVRSVDHILKKDFGLADGLADSSKVPIYENKKDNNGKDKQVKMGECHKVLILDPAVGTGTFLHGVIDHIYEYIVEEGQRGNWSGYVSKNLLPRLFGFELLMAPYTVAHMKLDLQLKRYGYDFKAKERVRIYLTNTLVESFKAGPLPFGQWIVNEANEASNIKSSAPVMVVLGNPPYSGHSANKGKWITNLLHGEDILAKTPTEDYFKVNNDPLKERQVKWLYDDYVKFIRFAHWRIEQTGYGILAFITNHSYLDNPTFRGMRQSLMSSFDKIYLLDLHGNSKKKEVSPDGSKDENVFDIQQGVAIGIYIKEPKPSNTAPEVYHADLWGLRETYKQYKTSDNHLMGGKYYWLYENSVLSKAFVKITPSSPNFIFKPSNNKSKAEFNAGWSISDIFLEKNVGFVTARDKFVIDFEEKALKERIKFFRDNSLTTKTNNLIEKYKLKNTSSWNIQKAIINLKLDKQWDTNITTCLYRPFDLRYIYYSRYLLERPVFQIQRHLLGSENTALAWTRPMSSQFEFSVLATKHIIDQCFVGNKSAGAGISYLGPLYLYPDPNKNDLFDSEEKTKTPGGRKPNLSPEFIKELEKKIKMKFIREGKGDLKKDFGPEDIFDYMYAVFHSPTYRERYAVFLKIDVPRLPLTSKKPLFRNLCKLGNELVGLHLMKKRGPERISYPIEGEHEVEKIRYTEPGQGSDYGRVWINKEQYFENVPPEVWEFHISGYQVCHKWLKDRKGRKLSFDDVKHYINIVSALSETTRIMQEIDNTIDKHGGWPVS